MTSKTKPFTRPRFGLRTLLILFTLTCVAAFVWIGPSVKQRMAVNVIRECGSPVTYHPAPSWVPNRVIEIVGVDFFCRVATVSQQPVDDVNRLSEITRLEVSEGSPGDLIPRVFPNLKIVDLNMKQASRSELEFLAELDRLEILTANGGLGNVFPDLPQVRSLIFTGSPADCQALTSFPNLDFLKFEASIPNVDEIENVKGLKKLRYLFNGRRRI